MAEQGVPDATIAKALGHKEGSTTAAKHYIHSTKDGDAIARQAIAGVSAQIPENKRTRKAKHKQEQKQKQKQKLASGGKNKGKNKGKDKGKGKGK